jgi:hypothetical protein
VVDRGVLQDMQELPQDREVSDGEGERGIRSYLLEDNVLHGCVFLRKADLQRNNTEDSENTKQVLVSVVP